MLTWTKEAFPIRYSGVVVKLDLSKLSNCQVTNGIRIGKESILLVSNSIVQRHFFTYLLTLFLYHFEEMIPISRHFYADIAISNVALLHTEHFLLQAIHLKGSLSTGFSQTSTRNWCMERVGPLFATFCFRYKTFLKSYLNNCNVNSGQEIFHEKVSVKYIKGEEKTFSWKMF